MTSWDYTKWWREIFVRGYVILSEFPLKKNRMETYQKLL